MTEGLSIAHWVNAVRKTRYSFGSMGRRKMQDDLQRGALLRKDGETGRQGMNHE